MPLQATGLARIRVLVLVLVILGGLTAFLWIRVERDNIGPAGNVIPPGAAPAAASPSVPGTPSTTSPPATPSPTSSPEVPQSEPGLSNENSRATTEVPPPSFIGTLKLIIPVVGVKRDQLLDTFADARSEGRAHDAIDIPAPAGTPVVAAIDGEIIKLFQSERGGTTIYQLSPDKKLVFYYAHLQRYADGIYPGKFVRQGEVIGYVGDTGNAGAANYHLHFSIAAIADPKRYWEGTNINPYPLLRQ